MSLKIQSAVGNLLSNAIEYSPGHSTVAIALGSAKDSLFIKVMDEGIGIGSSEQKRLFKKFYRSNEAKRLRPTGSGVGLYVVGQIVDAHQGSVSVHSEKGRGATFAIRLPLASPQKG